jgi:hypothetical protein
MRPARRDSVSPVPDSRARVRALFAVVILLFIAQVWFTAAFEEPYPALSMPDFDSLGGHAHGAVSRVTRDLVFGFADGSERAVTWNQLRSGQMKRGDGLAMLCRSKGMRRRGAPYSWFPSYRAALVRRDRPEVRAQIRAWLQERGGALFAGADPRWFECRLFQDVIRIRDGEVRRERRPRSTLRVELAP